MHILDLEHLENGEVQKIENTHKNTEKNDSNIANN